MRGDDQHIVLLILLSHLGRGHVFTTDDIRFGIDQRLNQCGSCLFSYFEKRVHFLEGLETCL